MKKALFLAVLLFSNFMLADIYQEIIDVIKNEAGNSELATCVENHVRKNNINSLSQITDLDCSCNGFYPPFIWWGQDINEDAREACEENRSYGPEDSIYDKNFVITSFAGLARIFHNIIKKNVHYPIKTII